MAARKMISSMTGFARQQGEHNGISWLWEIKSVNSRGLEVRMRVPDTFTAQELDFQRLIGQHLTRGSVYAVLKLDDRNAMRQLQVNKDYIYQMLSLREEMRGMIVDSPITLDALLLAKDLVFQEVMDTDIDALSEHVVADLKAALDKIQTMRAEEGSQIADVLKKILGEISALVKQAQKLAADQPEKLKTKVESQLRDLMADTSVDPARMAQEVALLASKADIREEMDRLASHLEQAQSFLKAGGVMGRRLDFLSQEMNREANTLCSKAQSVDMTRIGLDLKHAIEQFREQVQNIE